MKVFIYIFALLVIAGVTTAVAMSGKNSSGTWRYRVTVEIETPEGIKSGSAVRELSVGTPLINLPDAGNPGRIRGEAVVIDLGVIGKVFSLLPSQS